MKVIRPLISICLLCFLVINISAQSIHIPADIKPSEEFDNLWTKDLYTDELATSKIIWIRKTVELHKHEHHTEHIYVISGSGEMSLGGEHVSIVQGDLIVIPKNTQHSVEVSSEEPLKIISIQSPKYEGNDSVKIK